MRIENEELFFRVILDEKEGAAGLIEKIENQIPKFGRFHTDDKLEWHIENRYRERFTRLVNKHFDTVQLSLF